ncbi:MAG: 4-hydroxyphenylacetate 3-hydroxylase N-terminal domain-containing protein [Caldisphaera sp.]|jgi:aromatic ring hydroxylase|nr:4-hydroxyphenylacetate 3-hydroxylase N-terminal domain-containing protein [Caldisphaera sp.]PMP59830.1 MAG: hypothetical protein C0201_03945 [Caldisphaera sp.]PMP88818.1 MAG: hypothetical protein C0172_01705 [Caldisphaera sp.]
MVLLGPDRFISRLKERSSQLNIFINGEKVNDIINNPIIKPSIEVIKKTYELALDKSYKGIFTATGFDNEEINRFVHVEQSIDDLMRRAEAQRILNYKVGNCNYRCTGHDGINALFPATYDIDKKYGTEYHKRFVEWLKNVQRNDLTVETAMTDVKGNRSKKPIELKDNDMTYLHVVERRDDGIIVRGTKMHITGAATSDELLVVPTRAMSEKEKDYSVAFAVKPETKGIYYIASWSPMDILKKVSYESKAEGDYPLIYGHRSTYIVIFDDVFIPWERVFMSGEFDFTDKLLSYFIAHHRAGGGPCKAGFADVIIGSAALMADANGILNSSYIQDKLLNMKRHGEVAYSVGISAMAKAWRHESGAYIPDTDLANLTKLEAVDHLKEVIVDAADIGGGIVVNAPSVNDLKIEGIGDLVSKSLSGSENYTPEQRLRAARLLQVWTAGSHLVGAIQGGGPPAAELLAIKTDLKQKLPELINNAKKLSGL